MAAPIYTGNPVTSLHSWQPVDDWSALQDREVEVHRAGRLIDGGTVDAVMADGSLLWLAPNGASGRRIIENQPGVHIRLID